MPFEQRSESGARARPEDIWGNPLGRGSSYTPWGNSVCPWVQELGGEQEEWGRVLEPTKKAESRQGGTLEALQGFSFYSQ